MDLGKSGLSTYQFLKKKSNLYLFDDKSFFIKILKLKKN